MQTTLPPAPAQHDQTNQNAVRREIMRRLADIENRLRKLETE